MRGNLEPMELSEDGLAALERAVGASGLYRGIVAAGQLPVRLRDALSRLTVAQLDAVIDHATGVQFESAREDALAFRRWLIGLPEEEAIGPHADWRWLQLAGEGLDTAVGLGQVVVGLLAIPEAATAFRAVLGEAAQ